MKGVLLGFREGAPEGFEKLLLSLDADRRLGVVGGRRRGGWIGDWGRGRVVGHEGTIVENNDIGDFKRTYLQHIADADSVARSLDSYHRRSESGCGSSDRAT